MFAGCLLLAGSLGDRFGRRRMLLIGLVIFAALLRAIIEAGTWLSLVLRRDSAIGIRRTLEFLGRLLFYVGVPAWLLIRFWPW